MLVFGDVFLRKYFKAEDAGDMKTARRPVEVAMETTALSSMLSLVIVGFANRSSSCQCARFAANRLTHGAVRRQSPRQAGGLPAARARGHIQGVAAWPGHLHRQAAADSPCGRAVWTHPPPAR